MPPKNEQAYTVGCYNIETGEFFDLNTQVEIDLDCDMGEELARYNAEFIMEETGCTLEMKFVNQRQIERACGLFRYNNELKMNGRKVLRWRKIIGTFR